MVLGYKGAEKGGVKVNLFRKKFQYGQRGAGWALSCLQKKIHKEIYKYPSHLLSKRFSNLLLGLQVKPKFQIVIFFLIPTLVEAALEALSLLMYLWFLQSEQKFIRIVNSLVSN